LATLAYRRADETDRPSPGPRWWIPVAVTLAVTVLVVRCGTTDLWPWLIPTIPIAILGPWLAAIDLDVQRLPDKLLLPLAAAVGTGVIAVAVITSNPTVAARAFVGGLASFTGHWLLHRISRGGLGYGDVKLAGILGIATASISLTTVWWSLIIGATAAAAWSLATRRRAAFAYGPWLIAGALVAIPLIPA